MNLQSRLMQIVLILFLVGAVMGVVLAQPQSAGALPAPTVTPALRPEPPAIETWGIPDPAGGEPAECAGQAGCGVMCFYVSENAAANEFELSCMAWLFE